MNSGQIAYKKIEQTTLYLSIKKENYFELSISKKKATATTFGMP
jgi:hypothetical protein